MSSDLPKLVRDRIPELIEATGRSATTRTLAPHEMPAALFTKLAEESAELAAAPAGTQLEELADVLTVLQALAAVLGVSWSDVLRAAEIKASARGSFARRLLLLDIGS
jgi:predicted house-cleaning noncanonical NTP pyrophosphatase (MazG superfamily)